MGPILVAHYWASYLEEIKKLFLLSLPLYFKDKESHTIISRGHIDFLLNIYDFVSKNKNLTITGSQNLRKLLEISDGMCVEESTWNSFSLSLRNTIVNQDTYGDIKKIKIPIDIIFWHFRPIDSSKKYQKTSGV